MDCEQLRARLDAYVDGELLPGEYEAMQAHAAVCAECAQQLSAAMRTRELLSQLPSKVAVPLTTQADWRRAVRKEAARHIRRRRVRFICGIAAALVLVLGATMLLRTMPVRNGSSTATIPVGTDEQAVSAQAFAKGGQADAMPAQIQDGQAEAIQARKQAEQSEAIQAQTRAEQTETNAVQSDTDAMRISAEPAANVIIALPTDGVIPGDGGTYEFVTAQDGQTEAGQAQTQPEQAGTDAVASDTDAMQVSDEPTAGVRIALPTDAVILSDGEAYDFVIAQDADEPFAAWKKFSCEDLNNADATIEALAEEYSGDVEQESQPEGSAVYRIELPSEYLDDFLSAVSHVGEELDSETLKTTGDDAIVYIQVDELAVQEYDDETAVQEYDAAE